MPDQGWIKLHREIFDSPVANNNVHLLIWIYILSVVNHEPRKMFWNGKVINIKRGDGIISQKKIAKRFKVSRMTVMRALAVLKVNTSLNIKTTNKFTYVSVLNYSKYQDMNTNMNIKRTSNEHKQELKNKRKEINKEKKKPPRNWGTLQDWGKLSTYSEKKRREKND